MAFSRSTRSRDGLRSRCKACDRDAQLCRKPLTFPAVEKLEPWPQFAPILLLVVQLAAIVWLIVSRLQIVR